MCVSDGQLMVLKEPQLLFHYDQATEDPRDGLTLFGPLEKRKPFGIQYAVVGTETGIRFFKEWVAKIQLPLGNPQDSGRPSFPGFEAAFGIPWKPTPQYEVVVDEDELLKRLNFADRHHRVYMTVSLYEEAILKVHTSEESNVDVWYVIVPDEVYNKCRPQSTVDVADRIDSREGLSKREVQLAGKGQTHFFAQELAEELSEAYEYEVNFHNQLKARLLKPQLVTQVIRESTIAFDQILKENGEPLRDLEGMQQDIAWHLATSAFYKAGGMPWKISGMREGVCYLGIVFKHVSQAKNPRMACCAAQMFLDSGDGVVFRGNNGPWLNDNGDFHVDEESAKELVCKAIKSYRDKHPKGKSPVEIFIHAKSKFNDTEWRGFQSGAGDSTNVVAVQIQENKQLKLYRTGSHAVLRGTSMVAGGGMGYLWTRGMVPRLRTYIGREVPNALQVKICRGEADIETVLSDVLALTKLNYNACRYGDGEPVTLKFADAVGEILTAGPVFDSDVPPLPFKHYI